MVATCKLYPIALFHNTEFFLEQRLDPAVRPTHMVVGPLSDQPPGMVWLHTAGEWVVREVACHELLADRRFLAELTAQERELVELACCGLLQAAS